MSYAVPTLVLVGAAQHLVLQHTYWSGGPVDLCPVSDMPVGTFISDTVVLW